MQPSTIGSINRLPEDEKRKIYSRVIPNQLLDRFNLPQVDSVRLQYFLKFDFEPGSTDVEMSLFHELRFPDPILYGHLTDTMNGQIHVLLYILNDPDSPRFDVDRMPDGRKTSFGTRLSPKQPFGLSVGSPVRWDGIYEFSNGLFGDRVGNQYLSY